MVGVSVYAVTDDSPISDETGPAAEGVWHWDSYVCMIFEYLYSNGGTLGMV